ncbi:MULTISPECIES: HlyD family secretion protein [unclassified Hyphomicrobium]|uniref:HlyD family secretion protein n=1 Tax=unclassified Hyphomicrobium TaxID=2619925 RepID=UPI000213DAC7|nr:MULTISPECIES: HlyD family secretion protein [unclassified Hyphomicrobium]CCB65098.1 Secretion protein HlyD family protein [Hyphomicrobium sp. MC1]
MQDRLPEKKPPANGGQVTPSDKKPLLSKRGIGLLSFVCLLALIAAGYAYWQHETLYPSTDNAQVEANIIQITPLVTGLIMDVKVKEFSTVQQGDVLIELNQAPFRATLKRAEIRRDIAKQQAAQATGPQAAAAKGNAEEADIAVAEANAELSHATIKAPVDGTVGKVRVQPGEVAKAGVPLFPLVDTSTWWVDANFKETDLARIKPGQTASVWLDSDPSKKLTGKVEAVSRASASAFSLMPSENATGSWVKVVQRFPVRIALTVESGDLPLGVGASASVTIDTTSDGAGSATK